MTKLRKRFFMQSETYLLDFDLSDDSNLFYEFVFGINENLISVCLQYRNS